jgi:hypothetical protein
MESSRKTGAFVAVVDGIKVESTASFRDQKLVVRGTSPKYVGGEFRASFYLGGIPMHQVSCAGVLKR